MAYRRKRATAEKLHELVDRLCAFGKYSAADAAEAILEELIRGSMYARDYWERVGHDRDDRDAKPRRKQ